MTDAVTANAPTDQTTPDPAAAPAAPAAPAPVALTEPPVVDPPADAPKLGEQKPSATTDKDGNPIFTYEPTGDAGLDLALDFVGKLGFGIDHPAMVKAGEGDFTDLKIAMAALGDKAAGWDKFIALGEQAFERQSQAGEAAAAKIETTVHETVGGAEAWADIQRWASANATPAEKAEINAMLSAGPVQARAAAKLLASAYEQAGGTVVKPTPAARDAAGNSGGGNSGPLSPREYVAEVNKLYAKLGNRTDESPEYAALRARAAKYRG